MELLDAIAVEAGQAFVNEFSETGTWTPAGGSGVSIRGIFDRLSEVTDIGEMIALDGVAATLTIESAAYPGIARDDAIDIRGNTYKVVGVEPDGTGHTRLILGI